MTPDHIRRTNRVLEAHSPAAPPLQFLFTPDDGEGEAHLAVDRDRIDPSLLLALLQQGSRTVVEGTIARTPDGYLSFDSPGLNAKRLGSLVSALAGHLPIVTDARLA